MQQRERERPVESKARPDSAVQEFGDSWTRRAHPKAQVPEPPPKARPKAAPEPAQEPVPKPAPKPAAEMMVIDADDDAWGDWPKGKNWWKKQRKRERQREAEAEERRVQELRDQRIAQELADEQALDPHATRQIQNLSSSDPNSTWHCSICMSEVEVGEFHAILPCFHMFHQSCALAWFNEGSITCPTCRLPAEDYNTVVRKPPDVPANDIHVDEGVDVRVDEVPDGSGMAGLPTVSAAAMPPQSHFAKAAERDRLARDHERRLLEEKQSLDWQNERIEEEMQKAIQESLKMQAGSSSSSSSAGAIPPVIVASVTEEATAEPEPTEPEPESKGRGKSANPDSADAGESEKADDEITLAGSEENEMARKKIRSKRPSAEFPQYQKK